MKKLSAIIFDLDGTLIDSSRGIIQCVNYALAKKGLPPADPRLVQRRIGTPLEEIFSSLSDADPAELVRLYREQFREVFLENVHLFPGVKPLLQAVRKRGYRLGVATAKPRYFAEPILEHLGVREYFDAVAGAEEVAQLKPSPDILQLVMARMGCSSSETLYVGDHPVDVKAARAAGIEVASVATGFWSREELEKLRPAAVLDSLQELLAFLPGHAGGEANAFRKRFAD